VDVLCNAFNEKSEHAAPSECLAVPHADYAIERRLLASPIYISWRFLAVQPALQPLLGDAVSRSVLCWQEGCVIDVLFRRGAERVSLFTALMLPRVAGGEEGSVVQKPFGFRSRIQLPGKCRAEAR